MHSSHVCVRCGAVAPADNGWCGKCGLRFGAPTEAPDGLERATAFAQTAAGPDSATGRTCPSCGARLADRADWCSKCGQSRIALFATSAIPVAAGRMSGGTPAARGLSLSAKAVIGASLVVSLMVVGSIAASYARTGTGAGSSGPATTTLMGAVGSGSESSVVPTSPEAASSGSGVPAGPVPSGAASGTSKPPSAAPTAAPSAAPTAAPTASQPAAPTAAPTASKAAATPTPAPASLAVDIASLPASMAANATVTLVVVTSPGASCKVQLKDHGGKLSLADGLKKKAVADASGPCRGRGSWRPSQRRAPRPSRSSAPSARSPRPRAR